MESRWIGPPASAAASSLAFSSSKTTRSHRPDWVVLAASSDSKGDWMTLAAPGSIENADGEVLTYVHVAQKNLMQGDRIKLVMAYTAFKDLFHEEVHVMLSTVTTPQPSKEL